MSTTLMLMPVIALGYFALNALVGARYFRVGGLRFLRIGRIQFSFCVVRARHL